MQYRAKKTVNLGGGLLLTEGQTADLPAGLSIPGLEPVLERGTPANALEHQPGERNLDRPGKGKVVAG
jgi:hypothetical protein